MKINIEAIPHGDQRYSTAGDWWVDGDGVLQVRVSKMSDPKFEALVVIHELTEVLIETVKRIGKLDVPPQDFVWISDEFDKNYELTSTYDNKEGEPGCQPTAPYYQGHMAASAIENIAAMLLGVNYNSYADEIASLP